MGEFILEKQDNPHQPHAHICQRENGVTDERRRLSHHPHDQTYENLHTPNGTLNQETQYFHRYGEEEKYDAKK